MKLLPCSTILFGLLLGTSFLAAAEGKHAVFSRKILNDSLKHNWNFEKSYLEYLCPSTKKILLKPTMKSSLEGMKKEWVKGRRYGLNLEILSSSETPADSSLGTQVDIQAQIKDSEEKANFRFWISESGSTLCMKGFNFY